MHRRSFLAASTVAAMPLSAAPAAPDTRVYALSDGIPHTPAEYAKLLSDLTKDGKLEADEYSRGGVIEKLELRMAQLLGKESAVWLPTGTLANHLAVRLLCGAKRRVIVQAESHLYRDCGDCAQTLSGLHLVGLAPGKATFSAQEVDEAANDALLGRVAVPVGALQIETPVRRRMGERFDYAELTRIATWARERRIGLHLDGARLFIESAYVNRPVREYAALFDTVYVSMYKYFNAASGAILAGPKSLLGDLYHTRRMFGAGLAQSWPFAAVALHYLEGWETRFRSAVQASEQVITALSADSNFEIERIPNGTNIFKLRAQSVNAPVYALRLEEAGITSRAPTGQSIYIAVNETWARVPAAEIVARFRKALG